ncbi:MAG: hypothetical protein R3E53_07990 [Myxococcota bacterium]
MEGRGNLLVLLSSSSHRPASILLSRRTFDGLAAWISSDWRWIARIYGGAGAARCDRRLPSIHRGCLAAS